MRILLKLREWVTVPEAAQHLSIVLGEEVSEADILRLALDRQLVLSVNFVNHARARIGKVRPLSEAPTAPSLLLRPDEKPYEIVLGLVLPDGASFLDLEDMVSTISGVWDLPMLGAETLDVEHRYQQMTGGPEVTLVNLEGAFVQSKTGKLCQLQTRFDAGGKYSKEKLEKAPWLDNYYPAGALPEDAVFVVRTDALSHFQAKLADDDTNKRTADQLSTRERDTLLKLVVGMAIGGYSYAPEAARSDAPREISDDLAKLEIQVTDDTVRKYLKEAASTVLPKTPRKT